MKFTIVTVTLNAGDGIKRTMASILAQRDADWEWIIKDGGSSDGSLESLPTDSRVVVVRQPDQGIYDAMNQAAQVGKGDYLHFLNAGDEYAADDVLSSVEHMLKEAGLPDMLCGAIVQRETGVTHALPPTLSRAYLYRRSVCQQAIFYRRGLFHQPAFDPSLRIYGDHDFFLRVTMHGTCTIKITSTPVVLYAGGGISTASEGLREREKEMAALRNKHFSRNERWRFGALNAVLLTRQRIWLLGLLKGTRWERLYQQIAVAVNRRAFWAL